MITHKQYLKALKVIREYKYQIRMIHEGFDPKDFYEYKEITKDTHINDLELCVRSRNILLQIRPNASLLKEFSDLTREELMSHKHVGERTFSEIYSVFKQAGITIK